MTRPNQKYLKKKKQKIMGCWVKEKEKEKIIDQEKSCTLVKWLNTGGGVRELTVRRYKDLGVGEKKK